MQQRTLRVRQLIETVPQRNDVVPMIWRHVIDRTIDYLCAACAGERIRTLVHVHAACLPSSLARRMQESTEITANLENAPRAAEEILERADARLEERSLLLEQIFESRL